MAKRAPNPNTAYGRKRIRQEHQQWKNNLTPEKRQEHDSFVTLWSVIILGIIMLIIFLIAGGDGLLKWLR